jgi:calmodulin
MGPSCLRTHRGSSYNVPGSVSFEEFLELMTQHMKDPAETEEALRQAFRVFDRDGDGSISTGDLRYFMVTLGEKLSDEEAEEMIRMLDEDGDGRVQWDDFARLLKVGS